MNARRIVPVLLAALLSVAPIGALAQPAGADVLVVGGTPAGVAAALAAASRGEQVDLVVRGERLGGVLTDAMMDQWDLNLGPDGASVEGGLFRTIYARLGDSFTPDEAAAVFETLVASEPRIRLIRNETPVHADVTGGMVDAVDFRATGATSLMSLHAPVVIDATDDGDVAALAGAKYDLGRQDTGRDKRMQPVTLMFTLTGVDWPTVEATYNAARFGPGGATDRRAWGYLDLLRDYRTREPDTLVEDLNLGHEDGGAVTVNAIDVLGIDGLVPGDLARARSESEREAPHLVAWLRTHLPGFERARIQRYADSLYVRETRHFAGLERLTADDVWTGKIPVDTIGLSSYPLDLHPLTPGERPAYAPVRHVYGIPFGTMVPRDLTNVVLASPAISASHLAAGSARVIPTTIEEGEAAGAAAALALHDHVSIAAFARSTGNVSRLRSDLARSGVELALAQRGGR